MFVYSAADSHPLRSVKDPQAFMASRDAFAASQAVPAAKEPGGVARSRRGRGRGRERATGRARGQAAGRGRVRARGRRTSIEYPAESPDTLGQHGRDPGNEMEGRRGRGRGRKRTNGEAPSRVGHKRQRAMAVELEEMLMEAAAEDEACESHERGEELMNESMCLSEFRGGCCALLRWEKREEYASGKGNKLAGGLGVLEFEGPGMARCRNDGKRGVRGGGQCRS